MKLMRALEKAENLVSDSFREVLMGEDTITAKAVREQHEAAAQKAKANHWQ